MPPKSPEDIIQAVYDAALKAIRTSVQVILDGEMTIDAVKIMDYDSPVRLKVRVDGAGENAAVVTQNEQPLPEGAATEAKQDDLIAKDFSTETTLAALLAKVIAAPATEAKQDALIGKDFATETTLAAVLAKLISAPATEAKQDVLIGKDFSTETTLAAILAKLIAAPATEAKQDALIAKDFATETTLAAILAKLISAPATEAKQDALIGKDFSTETTLAAILAKLISAPATEAKQDALLSIDFASETTLAAILARLIADPATEVKQDALLSIDYASETTLAAVLAKITAAAATEAKQDDMIASLTGGAREHREQQAVSTSYAAGTNSIAFSSTRKHMRIYCDEDMYWVDSAADDTDAGTKLTTADQRGFIKRGDKLEVSMASGITRLDFLAVDTAGAVFVTGLA